MKRLMLTLLLISPMSIFADCPTPEMFKATSKFHAVTDEPENKSFNLMGTSTAGKRPGGYSWYLYGYSIPADTASEAIRKANESLSEGRFIRKSQNANCSENSCSCYYKISIQEGYNFVERKFTAFVVF